MTPERRSDRGARRVEQRRADTRCACCHLRLGVKPGVKIRDGRVYHARCWAWLKTVVRETTRA